LTQSFSAEFSTEVMDTLMDAIDEALKSFATGYVGRWWSWSGRRRLWPRRPLAPLPDPRNVPVRKLLPGF
jgi:hypothetical protein